VMLLRIALILGIASGLAVRPVPSVASEDSPPPATVAPTSYDGPLFPALGEGGWGYISSKGDFVIPPQFTGAKAFKEGLAAVYVGGGVGQGDYGPKYRGGLWGFVDRKGEFVIPPQFVNVKSFNNGTASVAYGSDEKPLWGTIDDQGGRIIVKPKYTGSLSFQNGVASGRLDGEKKVQGLSIPKYEYMDMAGRTITEKEYRERASGQTVEAYTSDKPDRYLRGLRKFGGKTLVAPKYDVLSVLPNSGSPAAFRAIAGIATWVKQVEPGFAAGMDCRYGVIDDAGKTIVDFDYTFLGFVGEGVVQYSIGGDTSDSPCIPRLDPPSGTRVGLLRLGDGSIVAPPQFDAIEYFREGRAIARQAGKWGVIDTNGQWVVRPAFDELKKFSEEFAAAKSDGQWGWIDLKGEWVIPPRFELRDPDANPELKYQLGYFDAGLAYVGDGSYIDKRGEYVYRSAFRAQVATATEPSSESNRPVESAPAKTLAGSAFFISSDGVAVTNAHVVNGCHTVLDRATKRTGEVLAVDAANDMALVKFAPQEDRPVGVLRQGSPPKLGEEVVVFGFPLTGLLSPEGVVTTGSVSAAHGPGGDSRFFQISAPLQSGNSGGPVLDRSGNVIGVAVAKLNALKLAAVTGELSQNVNFAIKGDYLRSFLSVNGVKFSAGWQANDGAKSEEVAARAKAMSLNIECSPKD